MKILIDYFAIAAFFIVYIISKDILLSTAVLIVASIIQVLFLRYSTGKWEKIHLITLFLVVSLGGITLVLQDSIFIKWKPSIVNWLFALVLLGSNFVGSKNILHKLLEKKVTLPPKIWSHLSYMWILFFIVMGAVNLYVAYSFSEQTWVYFKMFGLLGLTFVFILVQTLYIAKYLNLAASGKEDVVK